MSRLLLILFIVFGCSKNTLNDVSSDESSIILDYRAYKGNGLSNFYIDHDGLRREFFLYIPSSIGSKNNPVIFSSLVSLVKLFIVFIPSTRLSPITSFTS